MRDLLYLKILAALLCLNGILFAQTPFVHSDFSVEWSLDTTSVYYDSGPAWQQGMTGGYDFDGDGVGEFYASYDAGAPGDYVLYEFQPDGNGGYEVVWQVTVPNQTGARSPNQRVIALGDVNGNGTGELFFGHMPDNENDANMYVYELSGTSLPTTPTAQLLTARPTRSDTSQSPPISGPFWAWEGAHVIADVDNDGQTEFVGSGEGVVIFEFDGDWTDPNAPDDVFYEFSDPLPSDIVYQGSRVPPDHFKTSVTAADLDGDGDKDIVGIMPAWRHIPGNDNDTFLRKEVPVQVFEATGNDSYSSSAVLVPRTSNLTNVQDFPTPTGNTPDGWMGSNRGIVTVDIDNDNRDEIIHGNVGGFNGVGGALWLIDTDGPIADLDSSDFYLIADFLGDDPDSLAGQSQQTVSGDLDGDGLVELYVVDSGGRQVWRVEYNGGDHKSQSGYDVTKVLQWTDGTQVMTIEVGQDMDNDGRQELILMGFPGTNGTNLIVLESNIVTSNTGLTIHSDFNLAWSLDTTSVYYDSGPAWQQGMTGGYDFDGDGVGEFYASYDAGAPGDYVLYEFQPDGNGGYEVVWQVTVPNQTGARSPNQRVIALGDVNGNGTGELFFGHMPDNENDANMYVYELSGTSLPTTPTAQLLTARPTRSDTSQSPPISGPFWAWEGAHVIADVDNDGQTEFVGSGEGVVIFEFDGDWTDPNAPDDVFYEFSDPLPSDIVYQGSRVPPDHFKTSVTAADLDGDGDKDIVGIMPAWRHIPGNDNDTFLRKEVPVQVFEATGNDSYSSSAVLVPRTSNLTNVQDFPTPTGNTPDGWMGSNRGIVTVDIDNDNRDEIIHGNVGGFNGVGGALWLIDTDGPIADLDSSDFYLIADFLGDDPDSLAGQSQQTVSGDLDGDGLVELYVVDSGGRQVWRVEYNGGDHKSQSGYDVTKVLQWTDGTQVMTIEVGQDMDNDGRQELILMGFPGTNGTNLLVLESSMLTGIEDQPGYSPERFFLAQNYPNPFNPETIIEFNVPVSSVIKLEVYNVLGQQVTRLVNNRLPAGSYQVVWNGTDAFGNQVSSGVYIYSLSTDGVRINKKMMLMK